MSNTATHTADEPPATTASGLTGAHAAVYAALLNTPGDEGITATELALAAQLGRSTTGKALTALERRNLAVRTPGGHNGPRRTPDLWYPAPQTTSTSTSTSTSRPEGQPSAESTSSPAPLTETPKDTEQHEDNSSKDEPRSDSNANHQTRDAQADAASIKPETAASAPADERKRLLSGELRVMVLDYLQTHPDETFTATRISRLIYRSSGAIANALDKLRLQGLVEQVSERPRTFKFGTAQASTNHNSE